MDRIGRNAIEANAALGERRLDTRLQRPFDGFRLGTFDDDGGGDEVGGGYVEDEGDLQYAGNRQFLAALFEAAG